MSINQSNLVSELKNKNTKALDYLTDHYGNLLMKVAYSVLKDREKSLECVNDSLFKIWNNIEYFTSEDSKFATWIIVITKRTAIDELRKAKKLKDHLPLEDFITSDALDITKILEDKEFRKSLLNKINSMEKINKEIFLRRFFLEEPISDIAKRLNLSVSSISNRILRGKKKLEYLKREEVI